MFTYQSKTYKTESAMKAAKTRFRKSELVRLSKGPQTNTVITRMKQIRNNILNEQKQAKDRRNLAKRVSRQIVKFDLPHFIDTEKPLKKPREDRVAAREEAHATYLRNLENIEFSDKVKNSKSAISGRIQEATFDDDGDLDRRHRIIESKLMRGLYDAQSKAFIYQAFLTLNFIVEDISSGDLHERYAMVNARAINTKTDVQVLVQSLFEEYERVLEMSKNSSKLVFKTFKNVIIHTSSQKRKGVQVGSYFEAPAEVVKSKSIINIKNLDNRCLEYCLLQKRYPNETKNNKEKPSSYKRFFQFINIPEGQEYPIDLDADVPKYELLNKIKINIYKIEYNQFLVVYDSLYKAPDGETMNLLMITQGDNNHFCLIRDIPRLTAHLKGTNKNNKMYTCDNCHNYKHRKLEQLELHHEICIKNEQTQVKLPKKGDVMKFRNQAHEFEHPFTCSADFESTLTPVEKRDDQQTVNDKSNTKAFQRHDPNSFGINLECIHTEHSIEYQDFLCADNVQVQKTFVEKVEDYAHYCYQLTQKNKSTINWTDDIKESHKAATNCQRCDCVFDKNDKAKYKVAHHDHITGEFIGSFCCACNLKYQYKKFLPVYMHNLRGYDSHLFIKSLFYHGSSQGHVSCIPNTEEKYLSFSKKIIVDIYEDNETGSIRPIFFEIRFIDSYAMLNTSLEELVENLKKDTTDVCELRKLFVNTSKAFPVDADFLIMTQKGVYPYEYIDDFQKLSEYQLPKRKCFYSRLKNAHISIAEYSRALHTFSHFKCKSIMDYHRMYLKADVLLLSDVLYNFKKVCMSNYHLDPTYYYSAPSLAWDSLLKMTEIELELISDYDKYLFIENSIRGGLSQISGRYSKANNRYMNDYDKTKEDVYITYFDMNALYCGAMYESLPYRGFEWNTDTTWTEEKILTLNDDDKIGYTFCVDLTIPKHLHEYFNNYTPLPVNRVPQKSDLSPEQQENYVESNVKKLCCSLENRVQYTLNYRLLRTVLELGFKLGTVHQVLQYEQKPFMKPFMELNAELRRDCNSEFERDFYKLISNACFGKTMENLRKRIDFTLVTSEDQLDKIKRLKRVTIFDDDLIGVHCAKSSVKLCKPIYIGSNVLDDSKRLMLNFHYNFMKVEIKPENLKLLMTDTDSLCYEIKNQDIYALMKEHSHLFDLSNFSKETPPDETRIRIENMYDGTNKKVPRMMKHENPIYAITEFIGHQSKVYSYVDNDFYNGKKNKGINKSVMAQFVNHQHYKDCLFSGKDKYIVQTTIQSHKHVVYTCAQKKKCLSRSDDKVFIMPNGIDTRTHGYNQQDEEILE